MKQAYDKAEQQIRDLENQTRGVLSSAQNLKPGCEDTVKKLKEVHADEMRRLQKDHEDQLNKVKEDIVNEEENSKRIVQLMSEVDQWKSKYEAIKRRVDTRVRQMEILEFNVVQECVRKLQERFLSDAAREKLTKKMKNALQIVERVVREGNSIMIDARKTLEIEGERIKNKCRRIAKTGKSKALIAGLLAVTTMVAAYTYAQPITYIADGATTLNDGLDLNDQSIYNVSSLENAQPSPVRETADNDNSRSDEEPSPSRDTTDNDNSRSDEEPPPSRDTTDNDNRRTWASVENEIKKNAMLKPKLALIKTEEQRNNILRLLEEGKTLRDAVEKTLDPEKRLSFSSTSEPMGSRTPLPNILI